MRKAQWKEQDVIRMAPVSRKEGVEEAAKRLHDATMKIADLNWKLKGLRFEEEQARNAFEEALK